MIARFRVLLPFSFTIPEGETLPPLEFNRDPYKVRIHAPLEAAVDPMEREGTCTIPLHKSLEKLKLTKTSTPTGAILMDGRQTSQANLLQIDFLKEGLERPPRGTPPEEGDPPVHLAFDVTNDLLTRLRILTRAGQIKPLSSTNTFWRLDYLKDNGEELERDPKFLRARFAGTIRFRALGVNKYVWESVGALPEDLRPAPWDFLLLDAKETLPEIGPSMVLAYTALETFISWCLDQLAARAVLPPGLWFWINERDNDPHKQPSPTEEFDVLLRVFTGHSLKEKPELWDTFQRLRKARNSFVHEGRAVVGNEEITARTAARLVRRAVEVVDWVEALLPADLHRPKLAKLINFQFQRPA